MEVSGRYIYCTIMSLSVPAEAKLAMSVLHSILDDVRLNGFSFDYMDDLIDFINHTSLLCEIAGIELDGYLQQLLLLWRSHVN